MSAEPAERSSLIDVTYADIHAQLDGHLENTNHTELAVALDWRVDGLKNISEPFGKPSDASKKKIQTGAVTLPDAVVVPVEGADEYIFAITDRFQIDQVAALTLCRSFLYNGGTTGDVEELVKDITQFYFQERTYFLRIFIPLFRARSDTQHPVHSIACKFLPRIVPDAQAFAETLIKEYVRKTQEPLPPHATHDPKTASLWAKQIAKEQLVLLEVLFWTMFDYAPCNGPLVVQIYETAYATNLGSVQQNSMALLDEEGTQLQKDSAALWIVIMVEVLSLERISDEEVEVTESPSDAEFYTSCPKSLHRIHELVTSHPDSQHACTYLAWSFVLSRLTAAVTEQKKMPESYRPFFEPLLPHLNRSKEREPTHVLMTRTCLSPEAGLFNLLLTLLKSSPIFVTSVAWRTGSSVTDPNATSFRAVIKGLIMALVELVPVELIPDFDGLVEVWVTLFGASESNTAAALCHQFWETDFKRGVARRAILDVARSRFPIHLKPLIRLLRAMTGTGFLDTDPLSTAASSTPLAAEGGVAKLSFYQEACDNAVADYLYSLSTYSQVIPISACSGPNALYEKVPERYGSSSAAATYTNARPIRLPGGETLPARSTGRLLSGDGGDFVVICWEHTHPGWSMLLEVLTDYVNRKHLYSGGSALSYNDVSFSRQRGNDQSTATLRLEDIGVEMAAGGDEEVVTDALDLVRSVIQDNPDLAKTLVQALESGKPVVAHTMSESQPPDLVQLTTMVLEYALSRSGNRSRALAPSTQLITSCISVLSALLTIPNIAGRVWLYIRSATSLFGSDRTAGFATVALAAERVSGHYTMTLALLQLVQGLFHEASSSTLTDSKSLQQIKEEVLLRAASFVHTEIWVEHMSWKYAQLADRFEIGKRITTFYGQVMEQTASAPGHSFSTLGQAVTDAWVHKATTSTINPLITCISTAGAIFRVLNVSRRTGDARRLVYLLRSHLRLTSLVLNFKQRSTDASLPCLLEQAFCTRVTGAVGFDSGRSKLDPIDVLADYVKARDMGVDVPLEAMRVLYALCASFSSTQPTPPTVIGHLSDPEATVASLVQIIHHPYFDSALRIAVWRFIALAVDKEPALASLFVAGQFRLPSHIKGKGKAEDDGKPTTRENDGPSKRSAMDVARDRLATWSELRELNAPLLASVLRFLDVVWQHGLEHQAILQSLRKDSDFWDQMAAVAREEVGPPVSYRAEEYTKSDEGEYSELHVAVSENSHRAMIKSYALRIIGTDISIHLQIHGKQQKLEKPTSYSKVEEVFKDPDQLNDLVCDSVVTAYDPTLHDEFMEQISTHFPSLALDPIRSQLPVEEREFGDNFTFSTSLLRNYLPPFSFEEDPMDGRVPAKSLDLLVRSINLNLSLAHSQSALTDSVQFLLRQVVPFVRGDVVVRPIALEIAATVSRDTAKEKRPGDMMAAVHGGRLSLLLGLVEVAWFSNADKKNEVESFIQLVNNVHGVLVNEPLSPTKSLLGQLTVPFHRTLLQVIFFCAKHCRNLAGRPKVLNADQRLAITSMFEATLHFVIEALQVVFGSARGRLDLDLDKDMELLVAVFEQCTRPDFNKSSIHWLIRCQETDVIKSSLDLFTHVDLVGLSDLSLLRARKQPLYAPHILAFHVALAGVPSAAERFAGEGVLAAYSSNSISSAISAGLIDVILPELPGERSPAHRAYCSMLAIVSGVLSALGRQNHFFDAEASGFVQLYGDQITRALSWTIGDSITFPLLEEIEQVVNLFYSIAANTPSTRNTDPAVSKVLRVFSTHALSLLQQVNYALTHPNHLASLFEPVTNEERSQMEKEPRESAGSSLSSSETMDPLKRPLTTRLMHRFFRLSNTILATLISISHADDVLLKEREDWPLNEALIVPHSKVVLDESASIGTLLELGNCALDVLRDLSGRPIGQAIVPPSLSTFERPLDVKQGALTSRRTLEAVCLYAVTQLAMWVSKPDFDASGDIELDDVVDNHSSNDGKDRERRKVSVAIGERFRRGMTGEMSSDLRGLLQKAKPVMVKTETMLGAKSDVTDLTQVLLGFLEDHIESL